MNFPNYRAGKPCVISRCFWLCERLLKEDLHLKSYIEHEYHKLKPAGYGKRVEFTNRCSLFQSANGGFTEGKQTKSTNHLTRFILCP